MTITLGWWLAPLAVTIASFWTAREMNRESGSGWFSEAFSLITYLLIGVVPSLIAWLIWALLK